MLRLRLGSTEDEMSEFERIPIPQSRSRSFTATAIDELPVEAGIALRVPIPEGTGGEAFRHHLIVVSRYKGVRICTRIRDGAVIIWRRE